jgi:ribosome assembly protein YihI (activator of Der GTPase)
MIKLNEEYFNSPYYFFCKDKGNKIAIYFSVSNTISESRKNDEVIVVDKEIFKDIQKIISNILNSGKKLSKQYIHKLLSSKSKSNNKSNGEIGELVNPDGSIIGSNIPILNQRNLAKKTMDQTVKMARSNQFPYFRWYWNESKENNSDKLLDEVDQSETFGFEETEYASTYDEADEIFKDELGVEDDIERDERVKRLGFEPFLDKQFRDNKRSGKCKNCFTKRRLSEFVKQNVDEMIFSKKAKEKEFVKKNKLDDSENSVMSRLLIRNIEAIKRLAEKENIKIEKLIKHLKQGE